MEPCLLVLTGPAGAGKTSVADELVRRHDYVVHLPAVTTRPRRPDDAPGHYEYVSKADFASIPPGDLLTSVAYDNENYAIRKKSLADARSAGKFPIITVTADSAAAVVQDDWQHAGHRRSAVSIFLDAADEELDERLRARGSTSPNQQLRSAARTFADQAIYRVKSADRQSTADLVESLFLNYGFGGMLTARQISLMLSGAMLMESADRKQIQGASYDLRLGDEYFYGGAIRQLDEKNPILTIEPYDYAIVTSRERSNLPRDVTARFDLSVGLFSQGVILSNGPQVDPGFRGALFCLLFNTSSSPVLLKRAQHYATIEFHKLIEPTDSYIGARQGNVSILDYLPANAATGAINDLKLELEQLRAESGRLQTFFIAALSLMLAVIAVLLSVNAV